MRRLLLVFLVWGSVAWAEDKPLLARTLTQFGILGTVGGEDWSRTGWGVSIRPFFYLDPESPDGLYLGLLSGTFSHSAGSITVADTRLVTLGWRGNPLSIGGHPPLDFQADFSVSPTVGARISGNSILGGSYAGVGLTMGIYLPILDGADLGLSWEPTINVATLGGADIPEKSYGDLVLYWTMKTYTQTVARPWK